MPASAPKGIFRVPEPCSPHQSLTHRLMSSTDILKKMHLRKLIIQFPLCTSLLERDVFAVKLQRKEEVRSKKLEHSQRATALFPF